MYLYGLPCDKVPEKIHYGVFYLFAYTYSYLSVFLLFCCIFFFVFIFKRINVTLYLNLKKGFFNYRIKYSCTSSLLMKPTNISTELTCMY